MEATDSMMGLCARSGTALSYTLALLGETASGQSTTSRTRSDIFMDRW